MLQRVTRRSPVTAARRERTMLRELDSRRASAVGAAAALAAVTGLVATGVTRAVDQYAVDHLMPGLYPFFDGDGFVWLPPGRLVAGWNSDRVINHVADRVMVPASAAFATLAVLLVLVLARRLDRRIWLLAYAAALAVELIGKSTIHTNPLVVGASHELRIWKFDDSFPSGHATRAVFVAGLVATAWPRVRLVAAAWALAVVVLLVLAGTHTPSDVAGGVLLALMLVLLCRHVDAQVQRA
jgi:PAP2 superfamily protein